MFTLGNRGNVLSSDLEAPVIVPHAAAKNETRVGVLCVCAFISLTKFAETMAHFVCTYAYKSAT